MKIVEINQSCEEEEEMGIEMKWRIRNCEEGLKWNVGTSRCGMITLIELME
jgi:hypothetical protein